MGDPILRTGIYATAALYALVGGLFGYVLFVIEHL